MNKLVWLRNDLRTDDHSAFAKAFQDAKHKSASVYALYIICDDQWDAHHVADSRRYLVLQTLQALEKTLLEYGVSLLIVQGEDFKSSISIVKDVAEKYQCDGVYIHYEIALNERQRDKRVHQELEKVNVRLHAFHGTCLLPPKSVLKDDGEPYRVYTPFKNKCLPHLERVQPISWNNQQPPVTQQQAMIENNKAILSKAFSRYKAAKTIADSWLHEEAQILALLQTFCHSADGDYKLSHYHEQRDVPSLEGTSRLSPYLSLGSLSPKRAFDVARQAYLINPAISEGFLIWRNELLWRDFYRHIIVMYPHLSKGHAFKEKYENLPWSHDAEFIEAWKQGLTGYPIVDAAMRQLKQTGWMHNRLRMVTAMLFSKYALQDWHIGEQYFMSQLIDGDFAANNGGWQWSSSTGTDAAPYFRLLSPLRQAERFDADAIYIKNYIPELSDVPAKDIIKIKPSITNGTGYPAPIFDTKGKQAIITEFFKSHL